MKPLFVYLMFCGSLLAQCGDTLNWTDPSCQIIGSTQQLTTAIVNGVPTSNAWTVISRHGEYAQSETECNIPGQIAATPGSLAITTTASAYTCGNFNANGTINTTPASWPYSTGDVEWNTLNVTPGSCGATPGCISCAGTCTFIVQGKVPSSATNLWPSFWLLGHNCQDSNKYSGDTGFDGCPNLGASTYIEMDFLECYNSGGWCQFHIANPGFGVCDGSYAVDTNTHTWKLVWTATNVKVFMDGTQEVSCNQTLVGSMFFIFQTQTGGAGGTPNNAKLPAQFIINSVLVQDASSNTIFSDTFTPLNNSAPSAPVLSVVPHLAQEMVNLCGDSFCSL